MKEFVTLSLREKDYTFRALDLDQLEQLEPQFAAAAEAGGGLQVPKAALQATAEIAAASLQFKHAGITVEEVRKLLTVATVQSVMLAIRGISGVVAPGEAAAGNP